MQVTLLVDNLADGCLRSEHGISFLVQTDNGSVLFDTGQTDAWVENLHECGFELSDIKAVALSHGHYDHTGGLSAAAQLLPQAKLFAHPGCFEPKFSRSTIQTTRYIGMPEEAMAVKSRFDFNRSAVEILPGVTLSGEIPMRAAISMETRFVTDESGLRQDTFEDEQCLILENNGSVSVLVGCSHRGVENNVLAAMEVAGTDKIDLLAGGMHLMSADEKRLASVADFFRNTTVERIVCCHCTGLDAYKYLRMKLGSKVSLGRAGMSWQL